MGAGRRTVHDAGERCAALPEMLLDAVEAVGRGEVGTADRYRQLFLRGARQQLLCRFLVADVVCDHPCSAAREALGDGSPDTAGATGHDEGAAQLKGTVRQRQPRVAKGQFMFNGSTLEHLL